MKLLIKSATIIAPNHALHRQKRDLLIVDGLLTKIEKSIEKEDDYQEITFPDLHISIGWMDASVSFGEPGYEERETFQNGLKVAAKSGFTAIALNPNTYPVADNSGSMSFIKLKSQHAPVDVYPIGSFTNSFNGSDMAELYDMHQSGAIAFYDYKKPIQNANLLKMGMLYCQSFDGLLMSFPQEFSTSYDNKANESGFTLSLGFEGSPSLSEELQIGRDLMLLEYTDGKLHIPTISTERSLLLIKEAHKKGLNVSCSVTPHHLSMTDEMLENFNSNYKVNPPLRNSNDLIVLQKGVKDGIIAMIVSDHAPIDLDNKNKEFSYAKHGTLGMESFFGTLNSILELDDFIEAITSNPRLIFKISIPKFEVGCKANYTLFNPNGEWIFSENDIFSTTKNSAFIGRKMKGKVYGIINNNQLVLV